MNLPSKDYDALLSRILHIMVQKGPKATIMDTVASELKMSKRTLYEIFDNKNDMLIKVLGWAHQRINNFIAGFFQEDANVLEAMLKVVYLERSFVQRVDVRFFRDMQSLFPDLQKFHKSIEHKREEATLKILQRGINQGLFRPDLNYPVLMEMLRVQMESLKLAETRFPEGIHLEDILDTINTSFLRSIVTRKGLDLLEEYTPDEEFKKSVKNLLTI